MEDVKELKELAESHSAEAVNASAVAQEAIEKARASQFMAVLEEFFNRGMSEKKFIDVGRIPFICDDVRGIHTSINEIMSTLWWIKYLVLGLVSGIGLILIGVLIAIFTNLLK